MNKDKTVKVPFKPKARLMLQLGERLIASEKIAISELIKNSYDACARNVFIEMNDIESKRNGKIIIEDDGCGMSLDLLVNVWMEPGTDYKDKIVNSIISDNKKNLDCTNRIPIGEKGIGRFGAHKLGDKIKIISKATETNEVELNINWEDFNSNKYLQEEKITIIERPEDEATTFINSTGTRIEISGFRKSWTKKDYRDFYRNAMSLTSPFFSNDDFTVVVKSNMKWEVGLFDVSDVFDSALWSFYAVVSEGRIENFEYKFSPYPGMSKIHGREITEKDEYISLDRFVRKMKKPFESINTSDLGEIIVEGYLYDFNPKNLELSQISDRAGIKNYLRENGGVRVYRDGMRIFDYGEDGDDWLGLDQSRINSPVAAIGNRQILAAISLSRRESKNLEEKTNREGFIENQTFYNFRDTIQFVLHKISVLRNEDKSLIKKVYVHEVDKEESVLSILENINLLIRDKKIVPIQDDRERIVNHLEKLERNYVEMKETLLKSAGVGLQYSLIAHEIDKMIGELKKQVFEKNIEKISNITERISTTVESIINLYVNVKKQPLSSRELLTNSTNLFSSRSKYHKIEIIHDYLNSDFIINCSLNYTISAIMNVIDNSFYWLKYHKKNLENQSIIVSIKEFDDSIGIIIADTGYGYIISPESAILPFHSSKLAGQGIGLGLYYTNEIMKMHSGFLEIINSEQRRLELELPKVFNGAITILHFIKEGQNESYTIQ